MDKKQRLRATSLKKPLERSTNFRLPEVQTSLVSHRTRQPIFCFVFGCAPTAGVLAKTQLIKDLTEHLKENAKRCMIPGIFDMIES